MTKQEVLEQIRAARAAMMTELEGLPAEAMLRVGVSGLWSIKDLLAPLIIWQSELITALSRTDRPKLTPNIVQIEDIDGWNMEQYTMNVRRDLEAVMEDYHGVHKHLLLAVEDLDDKTLNDVRRFPWMEGEPLWYLIAENGFWHEKEHADEIAEWRTTQGL